MLAFAVSRHPFGGERRQDGTGCRIWQQPDRHIAIDAGFVIYHR